MSKMLFVFALFSFIARWLRFFRVRSLNILAFGFENGWVYRISTVTIKPLRQTRGAAKVLWSVDGNWRLISRKVLYFDPPERQRSFGFTFVANKDSFLHALQYRPARARKQYPSFSVLLSSAKTKGLTCLS